MTTAFVCSGGGHLKELWLLKERLELEDVVWVTFDTGLSRSLLRDERWVVIPHVAPRDLAGVIKLIPQARKIVKEYNITQVVTTGAQVAVSFLPPFVSPKMEYHFIESATRRQSPSLSARIATLWPSVRLYSQSPSWHTDRWAYRGSVFDGWRPSAVRNKRPVQRVVVVVGTMETFGFRRLVERLIKVIPEGVEVLWQTGATDLTGLPIKGRERVDAHELAQEVESADVVVCHAGVGSALQILESGRIPVLVPRRKSFGEHVDDHQQELAELLSEAGLAVVTQASDLEWAHLVDASERSVERLDAPPPFVLS